MSPREPLIALISATPAAIGPATSAFAERFPAATLWNILDDRLLIDADLAGGVTPELEARMLRLIAHARSEGAEGILLTCSIYGPVAHKVAPQAAIPIYAADDAAFDLLLESDAKQVLVLAATATGLADTETRLSQSAAARNTIIGIEGRVAPGAFAAAGAGDLGALLESLLSTVAEFGAGADAILLAQYSLTPVAAELAERAGLPVIAGPQAAADALYGRLNAQTDAAP